MFAAMGNLAATLGHLFWTLFDFDVNKYGVQDKSNLGLVFSGPIFEP